MTKQEVINEVKAVERTCRGPLKDGVREDLNHLLVAGKVEEAKLLDSSNRQACGADFNAIILAGPFDGEQYAYKCPKCGLQGVYRAPLASE